MAVTESFATLGVVRVVWHRRVTVADNLFFAVFTGFYFIVVLPVVCTSRFVARHPVLHTLNSHAALPLVVCEGVSDFVLASRIPLSQPIDACLQGLDWVSVESCL